MKNILSGQLGKKYSLIKNKVIFKNAFTTNNI